MMPMYLRVHISVVSVDTYEYRVGIINQFTTLQLWKSYGKFKKCHNRQVWQISIDYNTHIFITLVHNIKLQNVVNSQLYYVVGAHA